MNNRLKILFLIHDLGQGGAEKVLVNLVNNMNKEKFDITVMSLFGGGVNEQFLNDDIRYKVIFKRMIPANSKLMKLCSPKQLHKFFIKEQYDIEISYLEGTSARIISGCTSACTQLISWVHAEQHTRGVASVAFRSEKEAEYCYSQFDRHVFVADTVKQDFLQLFPQNNPCHVIYNTVESDKILRLAKETVDDFRDDGGIKIISTGTLKEVKGFDRLIRIVQRLRKDKYDVQLYFLGKGPQKEKLEKLVEVNDLKNDVIFLGYQINPYKYVAKCDLFVCSSYREGFSTAATEALIVGTPVCTVEVSGMREMLGDNNEYGIVVDNDEEKLFEAIKSLIDNPDKLEFYRRQAEIRGKSFSTEETVKAVEEMLMKI